MPDSRPTGETPKDPDYRRNRDQQPKPGSRQGCKCFLPRSRFSFLKHLMNFSSLLISANDSNCTIL